MILRSSHGLRILALLLLSCSLGCARGRSGNPTLAFGPSPSPTPTEAMEVCPTASRILEGTDAESSATLECWKRKLDRAWRTAQTKTPGVMTLEEYRSAVRDGVIPFSGDLERHGKLMRGILRVLGLGNQFTKQDTDHWFNWFRQQRSFVQRSYRALILKDRELEVREILLTMRWTSSLIRELSFVWTSEELTSVILDFHEMKDPSLRVSLLPALRFGIHLLGTICPNIEKPGIWNAVELGVCFEQFPSHFDVGSPWFDFLLHPKRPADIRELRTALALLSGRIEAWFKQPGLRAFPTQYWFAFSEALGAPISPETRTALRWIRKLSEGSSTEELISPQIYPLAFRLVQSMQERLLPDLEQASRAFLRGQCLNPPTRPAQTWRDCAIDPSQSALSNRFRLPEQSKQVIPFDGAEAARIALHLTLGEFIVQNFDEDRDGTIRSDLKSRDDEVVQVMRFAGEFIHSMVELVTNVGRRLRGEEPLPPTPFSSVNGIGIEGLSKLAGLSGELLVVRSEEEHRTVRALRKRQSTGSSSVFLDRYGVAAALLLVDHLPQYRAHVFRKIGLSGSPTHVRAKDVLQSLPDVLEEAFPRTYRQCKDFGYARSCERLLGAWIRPDSNGQISASELDVIALLATSAEGMFQTCDKNGDSKLSWDVWDGEDELDCGFSLLRDIALRLVDSGLIEGSEDGRRRMERTLNAMNSFLLAKTAAKIAMVRGELRGSPSRTPVFWLHNHATIGSLFSLIAEIIDESATP